MAGVKISELPAASTPLTGAELVPIVQGGATDQVTVDNLTAGRSITVSGLTVSGLTASKPIFTDAAKGLISTGIVPTANGGTGSSSTTYCSLTANVSGILPTANGGTGSSSSTYCSLTANVSGTLPTANGGTGQTSYTNGQLLIGNTSGNTLSKATLTAGAGVTITNGPGSITITATSAANGAQDFIVMSYGIV